MARNEQNKKIYLSIWDSVKLSTLQFLPPLAIQVPMTQQPRSHKHSVTTVVIVITVL